MEKGTSLVCVLGIGHLAAAVRLRLQQMRLPASDMDCWINSEPPALFLACSDFENIASRRALTERARADRSTILFACLRGRAARVGPLITPVPSDSPLPYHLTRSWDFSPDIAQQPHSHPADTRVTRLAQIGATFVVGELAKVMVGWVTKNDARDIDFGSGVVGRGFPEVYAGTLVGGDEGWREKAHLLVRTWHPAGI